MHRCDVFCSVPFQDAILVERVVAVYIRRPGDLVPDLEFQHADVAGDVPILGFVRRHDAAKNVFRRRRRRRDRFLLGTRGGSSASPYPDRIAGRAIAGGTIAGGGSDFLVGFATPRAAATLVFGDGSGNRDEFDVVFFRWDRTATMAFLRSRMSVVRGH